MNRTLEEAFEYAPIETFKLSRVPAIKALRTISPNLNLRETLIVIANTFGFFSSNVDDLSGWREFMKWQDEHKVSFESVQGPHAFTILKAIAAKHGRSPHDKS